MSADRGWQLLAKLPSPGVGGDLGFFAKRNFKAAETAFEEALAANPEDSQAQWGRGWLQELSGDHEAAFATLEPVVERHPDQEDLLDQMARLALRLGKAKEADRFARALVAKRDNDALVLARYAQALLIGGHAKRAMGVITNAVRIDAEDPTVVAVFAQVRKVVRGDEAAPTRIP